LRPRHKLEPVVEAFDLMNRDSQRIILTDDGVNSTASYFLRLDKTIGIRYFPACNQRPAKSKETTSAYAPRQLQFALQRIF
jgi:hypothetical protein